MHGVIDACGILYLVDSSLKPLCPRPHTTDLGACAIADEDVSQRRASPLDRTRLG